MARDAQRQYEIQARRRKVAGLYLRRATQQEIADTLKCGLGTVNADIKANLAEWQRARVEDIEQIKSVELAELDEMERDCAVQFSQGKDAVWITSRLKVKERRAKMLGLDAPSKVEASGPAGGPLVVSYVNDWRSNSSEPSADDPTALPASGSAEGEEKFAPPQLV